MEIVILPDSHEIGRLGGGVFADLLTAKPDAVLGLATGSSPLAIDDNLDAVPVHCLTQGLGTIMEARHILLVATGRGKAEAVHHLVEGAVSAMWPATILQHHPHVTVLLDEAAASRLQLAAYYRQTYASKPAWQGL